MKALILAGGLGSRLRPFSHSMPKQLIPIANKPVLVHVIESLRELGATEVGVVVGDRGGKIAEALGTGAQFGVRLTYIPQEEPRGLAHGVAIARDFLGDDDFVMYLGDNMLTDGVQDIARDFLARRPAAQIVVHKVADPSEFGVAELDAEGRVLRLVEKPLEPCSDLAVTGVYFFTAAIHAAVAAIRPSARGELEITDAIQWLVERGADVQGRIYEGFWRDTGRVEDVLECNSELLKDLTSSVRGEVDAASELIGAVVIEPGARIIRSRLVGPVIVGAGSVVEDSSVGPSTTIGQDCELRSSVIEHSLVLEGAQVAGVGAVRGSVIGRQATVTSGLVPGWHRLLVGDHASVEVAA
ncbi:glucose-1-phosphate thymidylyltransferase [Kitasatospora albolonga]|uniref:Glucose-1-phosphate thymidylyltransferase n=1 Tax=Kitasatospora albolonga TaxID=68173 RepID=A0ABC8C0E7_9ACTN|nr:glucose-1-phosphate thymidylyltransferase [Kitasatospora albolonga]